MGAAPQQGDLGRTILNDDGFSGFAIPNNEGQSRARVCGKACVYYADQTQKLRACVVQS